MKYQSEERVLTHDDLYEYENIPEDSHILHLWEPLDFPVDSNYKFIHDGPIFTLLSDLIYTVFWPILSIFTKLVFNFNITGKENLKLVEGGKITVSNHTHFLDCVMIRFR